MKPIYIICLIVIAILLFLRWLVMRIYKKHIFSSSPSYTSPVKSNSLILKDDNSPQSFLWSHEYSNNFENDPKKETVIFSLSRDLMSPGETTFSLSYSRLGYKNKIIYYECNNVPFEWMGTSITFEPQFELTCPIKSENKSMMAEIKLVSINYVPSSINGLRNDSFNITFKHTFDQTFKHTPEPSKQFTFVCMANLSSPLMGPISDSLNTFLKTAISNTLIKLPTLTNSQIGDNTYWQATSKKSNITGACFLGEAIDNRLILRDIYKMSFGNFVVQDIQLFYSPETVDTGAVDQFGNKITKDLYTCSAKLRLVGSMAVETSGFAIEPLCHFGFNVPGIADLRHDEWKSKDTWCDKASVEVGFDDDPLPTIDIQFKVILDNYPLVVIDHFSSVKFVKKIVYVRGHKNPDGRYPGAAASIFSKCDPLTQIVADEFSTKLNGLVKDIVNKLITDGEIDKVLIDLLTQNIGSINELIKTNTPKI